MKNKRIIQTLLAAMVVLLLGVGAGMAAVQSQCPPDLDGVDTDGDTVVDNDHVCLHMAAGDGFTNMADGKPLYIFSFSEVTGIPDNMVVMNGMLAANWPAPTITAKEGQKLFITLTNVGMMMRPDLFDPHTVHFHGFPNAAPIFDGVPDASVSVIMMSSFTYFYNLVHPGTFMWHCHVEATEHMQMGMLGQLFIEPIQNNLPDNTDLNGFTHHTGYKYAYNDGDGSTYYDVGYPLQMGTFDPVFHDASEAVQPLPFAAMRDTYSMLNGRGYPDTVNPGPLLNTFNGLNSQPLNSIITATQGQKVLLRFSSLSTTDYFTVTVEGIPMKVIAKGAVVLRGPGGKDLTYTTNAITLGGGESVDVILDTSGVAPGTYFLYTTNLNHLSNNTEDLGGMMTEIIVNAP